MQLPLIGMTKEQAKTEVALLVEGGVLLLADPHLVERLWDLIDAVEQ